MAPTAFENAIRQDVKTYAEQMMACLDQGLFSGEIREAVVGALAYLVDDQDLIDDSVPTIGLLDDMVALVGLARILIGRHDLGEVLSEERVKADHTRYLEKQGLMMTNMGPVTIGALAHRGRKVDDDKTLLTQVRAKLEAL